MNIKKEHEKIKNSNLNLNENNALFTSNNHFTLINSHRLFCENMM